MGGPWIAGICRDRDGAWYLTDAESNGIRCIRPEIGSASELIVEDPGIVWPITPSIGSDGILRFTASQLNRVPMFSGGPDLVRRPWNMYSVKVRV